MRVALTIAESDPNGRIGIQADLRSFAAHGVFGVSAITALTAQNPHDIQTVPPEFIGAQIDSVCSDFEINATKIGTLKNAETAQIIAQIAQRQNLQNLVISPASISAKVMDALQKVLLPHAVITVFNFSMAARFCGADSEEIDLILGEELEEKSKELARQIHKLGTKHVLITGIEHHDAEADKYSVRDLFFDGESFKLFSAPRVDDNRTKGKGCALSAAITALLARDYSVVHSVGIAKNYVAAGIVQSPKLGAKFNPIQHFPRADPQQ